MTRRRDTSASPLLLELLPLLLLRATKAAKEAENEDAAEQGGFRAVSFTEAMTAETERRRAQTVSVWPLRAAA